MTLLISLLLAGLSLSAIMIKRAYEAVPVKELKKRARSGDKVAELLHKAAAYEFSLELILWALITLTTAGFFVYVSRHTASWFALLCGAMLLWFGFLWLPRRQASSWGMALTARISPALGRLASALYPVARRVQHFVKSFFPVHIHTGLYDKDDLVTLLQRQKDQPDNQISESSLDIAAHAIVFGDKLVRDILTPRRVVKMVAATDSIGPVLMDELHASGFSRFPVYEDKHDNIVGILYLKDLVQRKSTSKVSTVMQKDVLYIHEEQTLEEALRAVLKTHQHLFVVVNSFEEYVGVVSAEDIMEEIVGTPIVDEFDQYDDLRAVAATAAEKDHQNTSHAVDKE